MTDTNKLMPDQKLPEGLQPVHIPPIPKIHAAMVAVMRDVEAIGKNDKNTSQGFKFRGIDATYNYLHSILSKHGIFCLPTVLESRNSEYETTNNRGETKRVFRTWIRIQYRFMAEDGSYVDSVMEGEGMDYGDKGTSKSAAISHKYCLLQTFLIPTEEQKDPDHDSYEVQRQEQREARDLKNEREQKTVNVTKPRRVHESPEGSPFSGKYAHHAEPDDLLP